jgi:hypothetical protein
MFFYSDAAVKELKEKIQTLYDVKNEQKKGHHHKGSSSSIKDYFL